LGGPLYNSVSPLLGSATTTTIVYCIPSNEQVSYNTTVKYIDDVEFIGTLNDVSNLNSGNSVSGYTDWTGLTNSIQAQGEGVNIYVGGANGRGRWKAWVDWNKDDVFDFTTEEVYDSGGIGTTTTTFGFIIPANQAIGDYRIRIRFHNTATDNWSYDFNSCEFFDFWNDATGNPNDGDYRLGEAEDYLFTVIQSCSAKITSITDGSSCGPGTVTLIATEASGTAQFNWYDAETGGNLVASTSSGTWSPVLSATTTYWVTADDGICESLVRIPIKATVNAITTLTISPAVPTVCGEDDIIEISATGDTEIAYLIDEDFESGGLGSFNTNNIEINGAPYDGISQWQVRSSTFVPSENVWFPAISSGFGTNSFVMSNADSGIVHTENELLSGVVDSSTFTDLTLELDMYFSLYLFGIPEYVNIEVSTDGGATWPNVISNIINDVGYGTNFSHLSYDLSAYINQANLRVRVYYYSEWGDGVAVDNIELYGSRPLTPSFTWTGLPAVDAFTDAAATIPYVAGTTVSTVYIKPSLAQLELASFTFTANATLSNACTISKEITIINNTKIWQGTSSEWNDAGNWKPSGVPTSINCVIVPDKLFDPIISGTDDANAYNLLIKNGGDLLTQTGGTITVVDAVTIDAGGTFELEGVQQDAAQLIQVNDVNNSGSITLIRETNVRSQDYVYWSSPVENYAVTNIGGSLFFYWDPTIGGNPGEHGNWIATTQNMVEGKGYAVRGPSGNGNDSSTATWQTITFTGIPNNGNVSRTIRRGNFTGSNIPSGGGGAPITNEDDNWNLIGNPYPSALNSRAFLTANTNIQGTVYLWTHGTQLQQGAGSPFYGDYNYNYNISDYLEYNLSGPAVQSAFFGLIGSTQGFYVLMLDASATPSTVTFDNSMRSSANRNDQFFRTSNRPSDGSDLERHRIWLDLVTPSGNTNSTLVAYAEGATNQKDRLYDASIINSSGKNLYSMIDDKGYIIQGRTLPFDSNDEVPLGAIIDETGQYAIAIHGIDGLFETTNQDIFIEDLALGIIHNIKESPYFFTSTETGEFNDRFVLRFTDNSLTIDEFNANSGISIIAPNSDYVKVTSGNNAISDITVYDMLGRVLVDKKNVNTLEYIIDNISLSDGTLFVKVTLVNGQQKIKKVVVRK